MHGDGGGGGKTLIEGYALPYAQHDGLLKTESCAHVGTCHEDIYSKVTADKQMRSS